MIIGFQEFAPPTFLRKNATSGYSLVYAVAMSTLLLFSGLAYLKWQSSTQQSGLRKVAEIQAFYTAQAAVIAHPISFLRGMRLRDLHFPIIYHFNNGYIPNMGRFEDAKIERTPRHGVIPTSVLDYNEYLCSAVGVVEFRDPNGRIQTMKRRARVRVRLAGFSDYLYFSNSEYTRFHELQYFANGDTIYGKVHSNSNIGIRPGAVFYGYVTTAGRLLDTLGARFYALPRPGYQEHVRYKDFPAGAWLIRNSAATNGTWLDAQDRQYTYGLRLHGTSADVWYWETGTASPYLIEPARGNIAWSNNRDYAIFCTGDLWIQGYVTGRLGIAAEGNIRLMDNLTYTDAAVWPYLVPSNSINSLTVVSEAREGDRLTDPPTGILIANTYVNGRADGGTHFPSASGSQNRRDIALTGTFVALNSSVTFQEQNSNEGDEPYVYECPEHGTDERGFVYLRGSIAQARRNSFHRGNEATTGISTGYWTKFYYDHRYPYNPPPFTGMLSETGDNRLIMGLWEDDAPRQFQTGYPYERRDPPPQ